MNGMPPTPQVEKKVGPIVGALIIVLVLIIAALYFFGQKLNTDSVPVETAPVTQTTPDTSTSAMAANASSADDMTTLQADINAQMQDVDYSF